MQLTGACHGGRIQFTLTAAEDAGLKQNGDPAGEMVEEAPMGLSNLTPQEVSALHAYLLARPTP